MTLSTAWYLDQQPQWPEQGKHILACRDAETIFVYQAFNPSIGLNAVKHNQFNNGFSYDRMSWIKPNFLWMMYRSNWAQAANQEAVLAIRLRRAFFDSLLGRAVPSNFRGGTFASVEIWKEALERSDVIFQWDPDHDPSGNKLSRRAIQLGLRRDVLEEYGRKEILEIQDISGFVAEQRANADATRIHELRTPVETVYQPAALDAVELLELDPWPAIVANSMFPETG